MMKDDSEIQKKAIENFCQKQYESEYSYDDFMNGKKVPSKKGNWFTNLFNYTPPKYTLIKVFNDYDSVSEVVRVHKKQYTYEIYSRFPILFDELVLENNGCFANHLAPSDWNRWVWFAGEPLNFDNK